MPYIIENKEHKEEIKKNLGDGFHEVPIIERTTEVIQQQGSDEKYNRSCEAITDGSDES